MASYMVEVRNSYKIWAGKTQGRP